MTGERLSRFVRESHSAILNMIHCVYFMNLPEEIILSSCDEFEAETSLANRR